MIRALRCLMVAFATAVVPVAGEEPLEYNN